MIVVPAQAGTHAEHAVAVTPAWRFLYLSMGPAFAGATGIVGETDFAGATIK